MISPAPVNDGSGGRRFHSRQYIRQLGGEKRGEATLPRFSKMISIRKVTLSHGRVDGVLQERGSIVCDYGFRCRVNRPGCGLGHWDEARLYAMFLQGSDQLGELVVGPIRGSVDAGPRHGLSRRPIVFCIEDVVELTDAWPELGNCGRADGPLVRSLISEKGAEVREESDDPSIKGAAFVPEAGT